MRAFSSPPPALLGCAVGDDHVPLELVDEQGNRKHRAVPDCEHATIRRAFELDPASTRLDFPAAMRDPVKLHAIFRGGGRRDVFGYVFRGERPKPCAIVRVLPSGGDRPAERYGWDDKINCTRAC